jgi:hypothetical protein
MLTCDSSSNASEGQRHQMLTCGGGGSNYPMAAADTKGSGGGEDCSGKWYNSLNFFSHHCGLCFCLADVELYGRNSKTGNIVVFPLSQGIYPTGGGIYPKQREIPIELETVVLPYLIVISLGQYLVLLLLRREFEFGKVRCQQQKGCISTMG